MAVNPLIIGI